jgi:hypothetical protein
MNNTKEFMEQNKDKVPVRYEWLQLMIKDKETKAETLTGKHILKILEDERTKKKNAMGFMQDVMIYKFKEKLPNETYRLVQYAIPLWAKDKENKEVHYLIAQMSKFNIGDIITMEMIKSGIKSVVKLEAYNSEVSRDIKPEPAEEDIPIIEEGDDLPEEEEVPEDDDMIDVKDIPF